MENLYRALKRLIESGRTDGLQEKLDAFHTIGNKITDKHYEELNAMLNSDNNETTPEGSVN